MTAQARIEKLRELLADSTPLPWCEESLRRVLRYGSKNPMAAGLDDEELYENGKNYPSDGNADLIVALVNDAEALLELAEVPNLDPAAVANPCVMNECEHADRDLCLAYCLEKWADNWTDRALALAKIGGSE